MRLYCETKAVMDRQGGTLRSHFVSNALSEYDRILFSNLRVIVMKSFPISLIEDKEFPQFSGSHVHIFESKFRNVIFKLVELVEQRIYEELISTKGSVLYDGWTFNESHFVGVILSYCKTYQSRFNRKFTSNTVPR